MSDRPVNGGGDRFAIELHYLGMTTQASPPLPAPEDTPTESTTLPSAPAVSHGETTSREALGEMETIVVAIHGIGSQRRGDSVRSVARRFGSYCEPPLPVMPLGFFHPDRGAEVHVSTLDTPPNHPAEGLGFAEVFWADIPRGVAEAQDTLEETKAWGTSVVSRARATYLSKVKKPDRPNKKAKNDESIVHGTAAASASAGESSTEKTEHGYRELATEDFELGAGVIEEIVETLDVLENLLVIADKAGVFRFEIGQLLRDYIGDVQVVTEFKAYRDVILYRFHAAMDKIVRHATAKQRGCEIYLVAHSEGTVVSFLAMLQALTKTQIKDPEREGPDAWVDTSWVLRVRGFMTIGSPIDKHIVLWPKLWDGFELDGLVEQRIPKHPIKWRNYYDYGDPIGFKLDATRDFLTPRFNQAFEFGPENDIGFSRYLLPGKAHVDYWQDAEVFGHFIEDVMGLSRAAAASSSSTTDGAKPKVVEAPKAPRHSRAIGFVNMAIPYLVTALLHLAAVFVLSKAVAEGATTKVNERDLAQASDEAVQPRLPDDARHTAIASLLSPREPVASDTTPPPAEKNGKQPSVGGSGPESAPEVRTEKIREEKTKRYRDSFSAQVFLLGLLLLGVTVAARLPRLVKARRGWWHLVALVVFAAAAFPFWRCLPDAVTDFLFMAVQIPPSAERLVLIGIALAVASTGWLVPRRPRRARRALVISGALVTLGIIVMRLRSPDEPVWTVVLGGAAFVYLWWLGILLFDLSFVWHWYIRESVAVNALVKWQEGRDAGDPAPEAPRPEDKPATVPPR